MDEHGDWDLLHSATSPRKSLNTEAVTDSPTSPTSPTSGGYESDDAGAVKPDYFALDSGGKYSKKAPSEDSESDNPSWVDPEFFPLNQPREFWSDESGYTAEGRDIGDPFEWERENRDDSAESGEKGEIGRRNWDAWWKFPFEMVKLCVCRVRLVWSIPVAAAILGVVILGRKLLRSEERHDGSGSLLPFKMVLDEKRATQLKARAGRLNEALSVVMRVPLFRTSFPPGVAPWPVLGMY